MQIAICDDIKEYRSAVRACIKAYNSSFEVEEYKDGNELLESNKSFDLLFLDIEMPGMDGMTTAKEFRKRRDDIRIVFLTSHDEFVYDAYEVKAFNFLRKPIENDRLERVLKMVEEELAEEITLKLEWKGEDCYVKLGDIVYLEAYGDGVYFFDRFGNVYEERRTTLKYWSDKLKEKGFVQIHRAYLISMYHIERYGADRVKMRGIENPILMSRRYAVGFKNEFFRFVANRGSVI